MLTLKEAADYVGLSPDDLMLTRLRGLPPGSLGVAKDGQVYFDQDDLLPAKVEFGCPVCGRPYKTEKGLTAHVATHTDDEGEEGEGDGDPA